MGILRSNSRYIDCYLHEIGLEQEINNQQYINQINIDTVFVSPLRRTLQTCYYLFSNYPNKDQLKIMVTINNKIVNCPCNIAEDT